MKEYKYKAFISYRHLEPDMQAAEKLQKLLESYKPPKSLSSQKEHWRIFRDVSELQSSSDLSEDIRNAIDDSEFLIVICSPDYNKSKWCLQELTRFRELHDDTNKNIITLLVNGEPDKAFPEQLRFNEVVTTDEDGTEHKVKVEVEPLAANIKADSLKESMKRLNTEYLRIAAPLIGCDFNDLYQREKRREAQRRMRIFGSAFAVLSVITVISAVSAVTISKKNSEIKDKNKKIEDQYDKIEDQYAQIQQQYKDLLVENSGHLAAESEVLFSNNDLIPAISKALAALPSEGEDKPVIPEAEYALSREMGMFEPERIVPRLALRHESAVKQLSFMGNGKSVVSEDASGIYFWNAENGKLIKKITPSDSEFASVSNDRTNNLRAIIESDTDKTGTILKNMGVPGKYSYLTGNIFEAIYLNYAHSLTDSEPGTGGDVYISNSDGAVWRLDGATGDIIWKAEANDDSYSVLDVIPCDKYILRLYNSKHEIAGSSTIAGSEVILEVIDRETGSIIDYADVTDIAGKAMNYTAGVEIQAFSGGLIYAYKNDIFPGENNETLGAYEIKDHKAVLKYKSELPARQEGAIRTVNTVLLGGNIVFTVSDSNAAKSGTTVYRFGTELGEPLWKASMNVRSSSEDKLFLFSGEQVGSENDVLAIVSKLSFTLIDYSSGRTIKTVAFDSPVVDASFSSNGLIMFTVADGAEYVINVGSYTGSSPKITAYRVQEFSTTLSLCSYSRCKYVTAGEFANTAYIQYTAQNSSYTGVSPDDECFDRKICAVSDDGSTALISVLRSGEEGSESIAQNYIYNADKAEFSAIDELSGFNITAAAFIGNDRIAAAVYDSSFRKKFVIMNTSDGSIYEVDGASDFELSSARLLPSGNAVYMLTLGGKNVVRISADGSVTGLRTDDKELQSRSFAVNGDKTAVYAKHKDGSLAFEICDLTDGSLVTSDVQTSADVYRIFWQNETTLGVMLSDRRVLLIDAQDGGLTADIKLTGTNQEPVSACATDDEHFAVLCRDQVLYEADSSGLTGRTISLDYPAGTSGTSISEADGASAELLNAQDSAAEGERFFIWNGSLAWLIDTDEFKVRYLISEFAAAPAQRPVVYTQTEWNGTAGFFPVYTTDQLISAARSYLDDLGTGAED